MRNTQEQQAELNHLRRQAFQPTGNLARWLVILPLLFILPLSGAGAWMYLQARRELAETELRRHQLRARTLAAVVEREFETSTRVLVSVADRRLFRQAWQRRDFAALESHFDDLRRLVPALMFVSAYEADGTLRIIQPPDSIVGQNYKHRDWYRGVTTNWKPYVSEVYRTAVAPNPLIVATAVPITDEQGRPDGILMAPYALEQLKREFQILEAGFVGEPIVVDQRGMLVYSPIMNFHAEPALAPDREAVHRALAGEEGSTRLAEPGGEEHLVGYAPVTSLGWAVLYRRPTREALAAATRLRNQALTIGVYLLLIYLSTVLLTTRLSQREHELLRANQELNQALEEQVRELRRAQQELRQSAERIRDLYDHAPCGYHSLDAEGRFVEINDTELAWLGSSREELVGKKKFTDLLTPEGLATFQKNFPGFKERGWVRDLEFDLVRKDGTTLPVLVSATAIRDAEGRFVQSRSTLFDLTERRRAAEVLNRFFTLSLDLLCIAGFDGYFKQLNPAWEQTLGYTSEELRATPFLDFVHPDDREATVAETAKLRSGLKTISFENRYRAKDVSYRWLAWRALPVPEQGLIYATARDITERKETEEALRKAKEEAERASRFKDQFLSTMSHELRTPLNAVLGFAELLTDERYGSLNERQRRYVNHIHNGGRHLLALINDILDLSRIEAGRLELTISDVRVSEAFAEVVSALRPLAEAKKQALEGLAAPKLLARADLTRFKQVLMNLVGNAIKFTPMGGRIELRARSEDGRVRVEVRDTGPGIPPDEQRRIFEAFYRIRKAGEVAEGTGLGLAITQRLVELQGGQLGLESATGQGSCFYFKLPAAETPAELPVAKAPAAETGVAPLILVVEDDALTANLIRSQLTSAGYAVEICSDGSRAHQAALSLRPHAITLDILMEPVNGFEVLLEIKSDARTAAIPVIVLTIVDQAAMGLTLGADEYLLKPVEKAVLLDAVRRCLTRRGIAAPLRPILVVEDDAPTREAITETLTHSGYAVVAVSDAEAAREWVHRTLPEVVILDLLLPRVGGIELLTEWRASPRTAELPVFVLTGKDLTPEEEKYLRRQAELLLRKQQPWQEQLLSQLQRIRGQPGSGSS